VHVVVVIRKRLHDVRRSGESRARANENELRSRGDKTIYQVLREIAIDLARPPRFALAPVAARVVDVGIQAVLMGPVIWRANASAEFPTTGTAEVADGHTRRARILFSVRSKNTKQHSNELSRCVAPVGSIG